jgi:hypothetical protein
MRACRPKSSLLQRIEFDEVAARLTVTFAGRRAYEYAAVPLSLFRDLCRAASPGQFYNRHIKGRFACREVSPRRRYPLLD